MRTVNAYATAAAGAPFEPTTIERRDLGPHDVLIAIRYAGICHSDVHAARSEWGPTNYPFVAGHEIAGVVEEVGPDVTRHAVGDRVGVGCLVDSCGECRHCLAGHEQFCADSIGTYGSIGRDGKPTLGGYSANFVGGMVFDPYRQRLVFSSAIGSPYEHLFFADGNGNVQNVTAGMFPAGVSLTGLSPTGDTSGAASAVMVTSPGSQAAVPPVTIGFIQRATQTNSAAGAGCRRL